MDTVWFPVAVGFFATTIFGCAGWVWSQAEVARLKTLNEGLIERCAKQSDQLGRNAEKTVTFRRVEPMKPMPYPEQE
jgi:hypothetical protein